MTILIVLSLMFVLLLSGLPVSFSLGFLGLAMLIFGGFSPLMAPQAILSTLDGFILLAVPLFLLMSNVLLKGGCGKDLFNAVQAWVGHWPGGLAVATIISCGIFAAISGSSAATVATVGKMSIPELRKRNYPESFLLGTLAGSGTLGLLIPPSIILIIYGVTVEESIAKLFIAGIVPGIALALLFMTYVVFWSLKNKKIMPTISEDFSFLEKIKQSGQLIPVVLLIFAVIGSIYAGIATATEAASLGVLGALTLSYFQKSLTKESFSKSLLGATKTSCMIAFILAGSSFLTLAMAFTGLPKNLAVFIDTLQLSPYMLLLVLTLFYIIAL